MVKPWLTHTKGLTMVDHLLNHDKNMVHHMVEPYAKKTWFNGLRNFNHGIFGRVDLDLK